MGTSSQHDRQHLSSRLRHLRQVIAGVQESQEACNQCRKLLPDYVDAESEGHNAAQLYPQVRQHLETCLACQGQYADQLDMVRLEATNQLPQLAQTPRFDLSFLPQPVLPAQMVYDSARAILQSAYSKYVPDLELAKDRLITIFSNLISQLQPLQISSPQTLGFAGETTSIQWAVATLIGLDKIRTSISREEIERLKASGELHKFLSSIAQDAAKQAGIKNREAHKFAETFARIHSEKRWNELIQWMTAQARRA